ncbi:MAG: hypothetical protein KDB79_10060 [Acidobacteria bacterium]|nr:hypothetical protein [Acidobacteriota bacterium]
MNICIPRTRSEIDLAFETLSKASVLGCDTETGLLDPRYAELFSVQFSDGEFNVLVPNSEGVELGRLAAILEDETITKIFHNAKFDLGFLQANGYQTKNVYDTMIAEKVLTKGANQSVSLAETLYRYFAVDLDKSQRKKFGRKWNKVWTDELVEYALNDVAYLPKLMEEQIRWMNRLDLSTDYRKQFEKIVNKTED